MCKVRIETSLELYCTNLGSELCVANLLIGHVLAHALFPVWHVYSSMLIERWHIVAVQQWMKIPFPSTKVGSKFLARELVCLRSVYRNALFTDRVWLLSAIFNGGRKREKGGGMLINYSLELDDRVCFGSGSLFVRLINLQLDSLYKINDY